MELTGEQRALRESVAGLLRRHPPALHAEPAAAEDNGRLWRLLAGIGAAGLAIPECYGGAGAGSVEVSIVAEELGRTLAPLPWLGSAVLTARAILATGDTSACERLLPEISSGDLIAALAWTGQAGGWESAEAACEATMRSSGWTLTGTAHYVLDGDVAGVLIVAASLPGGGVGLFEVAPGQPGVERRAAGPVDQTRRLAVIRLDAVVGRSLGPAPAAGATALASARDLACIALSAEQVGTAAKALELTADYTKARVQFGRPIASFQAIGHRLAELHVLVESARALSYRAASVADSGPEGRPAPELPLLAAAAKSYCSEALAKVAAELIQLHGAIGITWEHDAHRYFKRAHGAAQLFGPPAAHLGRIADAVLDRS